MTTIDSPDIESLIAEFRGRHKDFEGFDIPARKCWWDMEPWPCPDRLLIDALVPVYEAARATFGPNGPFIEDDSLGVGYRTANTVRQDMPARARKVVIALRAALAGRSVTPDGDGRPVCGLCHNRHPRLMRNETCPVVGACDGVHYYVESRRICQTWASDCPDLRRC